MGPWSVKSEARQLLWTEDDRPYFPQGTVPLFTPEGMKQMELQPITEGFKFLGVEFDIQDKLRSMQEVDQLFKTVLPFVRDDRLPARLQMKFMVYTAMGKWRYLMDKVHESHAMTLRRARFVRQI